MKKELFCNLCKGILHFFIPQDKESQTRGWTFVETIIVIGIVLILSSSVGIMAFRYVAKAKTVAAKNNIEAFSLALSTYLMDCSTVPTPEQGLDALWERPDLEPVPDDWAGPYINKPVGKDPWGNDYSYEVPGPQGLPYSIKSFGADGKPGGEGEDSDIASW